MSAFPAAEERDDAAPRLSVGMAFTDRAAQFSRVPDISAQTEQVAHLLRRENLLEQPQPRMQERSKQLQTPCPSDSSVSDVRPSVCLRLRDLEDQISCES